MIDLLRNRKNIFKSQKSKPQADGIESIGGDASADISAEPSDNDYKTAKKVNLGDYRDPEGLTIKKLNMGLWLVKNRKNISLLFHTFLIMVIVVAWLIFFLNFGLYVVSGMNKDQEMVNYLVKENLISNDYLVSVGAKELKLGDIQAIKTLDGKYDIYTNIENVNPEHSLEFDYYFMAGNERLETESGFVLPRQAKYLLALNKEINGSSRDIKFRMENLRWKRIDPHVYPDWEDFRNKRLAINTGGIEFIPSSANKITEKLELNNLKFNVTNDTAFNYREVDFVILLYSGGKIAGVGKYVLNNLLSEQGQAVNIVWPGTLSRVNDVVVYPEINILDDNMYLDFEGGTGERK